MPTFRRRLGTAIRRARTNADLTQAHVAAAIGMTRASISNIEAGRQGAVDTETLVAIADTLGVNPGALLAEVRGSAPPPPAAERAERDRLLRLLVEHTCQHPGCSCPSAVAGEAARRRIAELDCHLGMIGRDGP